MASVARDQPPGIRRLAALVAAHGEALEADLAPLGIDLGQLRLPGRYLTWRKLGVLIKHLPAESHFMTAVRNTLPEDELARISEDADPTRAPWSQTQMMQAAQLDELRLIRHVLIAVNSKNPPAKPPEPVRRPGVAGRRRKRGLSAQKRRILDPRLRQNPDN